jgi:hypothetical protein
MHVVSNINVQISIKFYRLSINIICFSINILKSRFQPKKRYFRAHMRFMKQILETDRLRLREFNSGDTVFIISLLNSEGWLKFIGDRSVRTPEQAKAYLENGPLKSYSVMVMA